MIPDYYLNHNEEQLNRTISLCGCTCGGYVYPVVVGYAKQDGMAHDDYIAKGVHGNQHGSRYDNGLYRKHQKCCRMHYSFYLDGASTWKYL